MERFRDAGRTRGGVLEFAEENKPFFCRLLKTASARENFPTPCPVDDTTISRVEILCAMSASTLCAVRGLAFHCRAVLCGRRE